ncbi:hypothetical protein GPJ56_002318 [Histomonas meleagridis]|uniref:uncharacterized protein n=1 Tax=Histomonas meleagridis TaxID=135588 RepID=UPI003559DEF2|nr:hypothetical protein GPJ56_002318 [Histomonas meleagridis]KAH0804579.1 hypothetical protein GO595_003409 [Histomonas meleagridis]
MTEIVIWSISHGILNAIIPIENVKTLKIDEDTNSMFVGSGKEMLQYTLNGHLIRKISFDDEITAINFFGSGFTTFDKYVLLGFRSGMIRLCAIEFDTGEFNVIQEKKVSLYAINDLVVDLSLFEVSVYDLEFLEDEL